VAQVNLRKRFHLNIIVVIRNDKAISEIGPELVLLEGDVLVVGGSNEAIKKFERANEL